jgi:hypothetical protein
MPEQTNKQTHDIYPENLSELPQNPEDTSVNIILSCAAINVYGTQSITEVFFK